LNRYKIPFVGLKIGVHEFEYELNDHFFANYEYSLIKKGDLKVNLSFDKRETMMMLSFNIDGIVNVQCDRCLEYFDMHLEGDTPLIVRLGDEQYEETDDIISIARGEQEFDVGPYLYEFTNLLLPLTIIHPDDAKGKSLCNKETLKKIEELSAGKKTNNEPIDSRWEVLKGLYNKNN
jgi:uncharacterized protein